MTATNDTAVATASAFFVVPVPLTDATATRLGVTGPSL